MTRDTPYIPDAGDIAWLELTPQGGHHPVLILSPASYNHKTGLVLCCPLTTRIRGYPFEVTINGNSDSVILADQVRSLDWRRGNARYKGRVAPETLEEVRAKLRTLVG